MKSIAKTCLLTVAMLPALVQSIATGSAPEPDAANIADILEPIRKEYKLPALAAAVVSEGEVVALGAVGERKYKSGVNVTTNDRFHLGSCTKAMTATMIGMLVERGKGLYTLWQQQPELRRSLDGAAEKIRRTGRNKPGRRQ